MDFDKFKKINDERPNYGEIEDADVVTFYKIVDVEMVIEFLKINRGR